MSELFLDPDPAGPYTTGYAVTVPAESGALQAEVPFRVGPVPTLEATHTWDGQVALHDHRELSDVVRWRLRCRTINLRGMAEPTLPADPRLGGTGTNGRPGRRGGKTVTYAGAIEAVDAAALREGTDALEGACWDVTVDRPVLVEQDDAAWRYTGRAHANVSDLNLSMTLGSLPTPYQADFVVAITMNDPRIYAAARFDTPAALTIAAAGAGSALPWPRLPVVLRPPPAQTVTGVVEILGRVPTAPTLRFHGPCATPQLVDVDRGARLILDLVLGDGEWVDVNLQAATVTTQAGDDVAGAVRWPESTWWSAALRDVAPGPLQLQVSYETARYPARVDVFHYPAFP